MQLQVPLDDSSMVGLGRRASMFVRPELKFICGLDESERDVTVIFILKIAKCPIGFQGRVPAFLVAKAARITFSGCLHILWFIQPRLLAQE